MIDDPREINKTLEKIIRLADSLQRDPGPVAQRDGISQDRQELLRMIDAISESGVKSSMNWIGMVYRKEQGEAAQAELARRDAERQPKPKTRQKRPAVLPPGVVAFDRSAERQ